MIDTKMIAWIAGIIEGEGYLDIETYSPRIKIKMTDEDVISTISFIFGCSYYEEKVPNGNKKAYVLKINGAKAVGWMLTIFTYMHSRRRAKIKDIILKWVELSKPKKRSDTHCANGHIINKRNSAFNSSTGYRYCRICARS